MPNLVKCLGYIEKDGARFLMIFKCLIYLVHYRQELIDGRVPRTKTRLMSGNKVIFRQVFTDFIEDDFFKCFATHWKEIYWSIVSFNLMVTLLMNRDHICHFP